MMEFRGTLSVFAGYNRRFPEAGAEIQVVEVRLSATSAGLYKSCAVMPGIQRSRDMWG
jgi:phage gp37-like protein